MENIFSSQEMPELVKYLFLLIFIVIIPAVALFKTEVNIIEILNSSLSKYNIIPAICYFFSIMFLIFFVASFNLWSLLLTITFSSLFCFSFVKGVKWERKDQEKRIKKIEVSKKLIKKYEESFVELQKIALEDPCSYHFFD